MITVRKALDEAIQLATVASDWNLDEVEIDGKMVDISDVVERFERVAEELYPNPDWGDAPVWAMWWAIDADGESAWFEKKPLLFETVTFCGWRKPAINGVEQGQARTLATHIELPLGVDWRTTLRQRPGVEVGDDPICPWCGGVLELVDDNGGDGMSNYPACMWFCESCKWEAGWASTPELASKKVSRAHVGLMKLFDFLGGNNP